MQRGFIAQEVEKVMPEWIGPNDEHGFKTIAIPGHSLEALVVESIRTLHGHGNLSARGVDRRTRSVPR
jgi:hypothetical protein